MNRFERMHPEMPFYTISPALLELEGVLPEDLSFDVNKTYVTVGWKGGRRTFIRSNQPLDISVSQKRDVLTVSVS